MFGQLKSHPSLFQRLGAWWCRTMHDTPMWPVHGHYRCRTCARTFAVPWAGAAAEPVRLIVRPEPRVLRRAA
jgi:hypothetical protein